MSLPAEKDRSAERTQESRETRKRARRQAFPESVGPYRIRGVLGEGGMGRVYLAEGTLAGSPRLCALKVLHASLAGEERHVRMFCREAELGSDLQHPGLCRVLDHGNAGDDWYMAQELLQGRTLKQVYALTRGTPPSHEYAALLCYLFVDFCDAAQALHEATDDLGVPLECVHRDISPDNLFISFDGTVKLLDLGLAKLPGRSEKTEEGMLKGKISYLAPELLDGKSPSWRSDVWALGVCLWELCVGQRLFDASSDVLAFRAVTNRPISPPSEIAPELPRELDAVVMKALARDPDDRYASADEFSAALSGLLQRLPLVRRAQVRSHMTQWFPGELLRQREMLRGLGALLPAQVDPAPIPTRSEQSVRTAEILERTPGAELPCNRWVERGTLMPSAQRVIERGSLPSVQRLLEHGSTPGSIPLNQAVNDDAGGAHAHTPRASFWSRWFPFRRSA